MGDTKRNLYEIKEEANQRFSSHWNREKRFAELYNQYSKKNGEGKPKEDRNPGNSTNVLYKTN